VRELALVAHPISGVPSGRTWLDFAAGGGRPDLRLVARDADDLLFDASAGGEVELAACQLPDDNWMAGDVRDRARTPG